uniref:Pyrophosphate--fructose 6-phosphate 1-phosphotransferase n=1 Tax=Pyrodinium bahamense TaxID=73915 RepID=A0A7S0A7I1_9DINO
MAPNTEPQLYNRARKAYSSLQRERLVADCQAYLPAVLDGCPKACKKEAVPASAKDAETIKGLFPHTYDTPAVEFERDVEGAADANQSPVKVGVVLSGGQAPGGHNVIAGIFDSVKRWHKDSAMIGFLDGPHGVFSGNFVEISSEIMDGFRNTGGFDMLGSGRHKIETEEQFQNSMTVCQAIGLDGLVVIGGDDSNTNGAVLAEYFKAHGCKTKVVGAPKTIDGDLKCPPHIPVSFGFDTACKTFAGLVGNISVDALSAQKYYHLVRLMGRSASNIALEVALLTRPNMCVLGEEVSRDKKSLKDITVDLADMIEERSKAGKDYGVIILPEGLIEFIPEFNSLISEINDKLATPGVEATEEGVLAVLSPENADSFRYLPSFIRGQLLLDRDPHGNVQVAKIETEKLLAATVAAELEARRAKGTYSGHFSPQFHSYGYEGRAGMPTVFDASYCYALGATAAYLLCNDLTGLIASVKNLLAPVKEWQCGGVPITSLCVIERRKGKDKPVIRKALVELEGELAAPYKSYSAIRGMLRLADAYSVPGPMQFDMLNCPSSTDIPVTLQLELGRPLPPPASKPAEKQMGGFLYVPQTVESRSALQQWRLGRKHQLPAALSEFSVAAVEVREGATTMCFEHEHIIRKYFQHVNEPLVEIAASDAKRTMPEGQVVGVVFCGRQAPGCHDLVCGLVDMLRASPGCKVLGFVGGTKGLFEKHCIELTSELCEAYRGTGGLELLGRTVDRIGSPEELASARKACEELQLTGLVLVGGARTNTDAAYLAEHFRTQQVATAVVGVPCGIEGSMVNEFVEASLGFDSAAKTMAQLVGNTAIDGSSARKYYYFMKLMDGSTTGGKTPTSHVALEAALQTKPNLLLLTEEVDEKRMSLREVVKEVADVVAMRARDGKNFGTILVAEGLLAAIPEFRSLIQELEALPMPSPVEKVLPELTQWSRALFQSLPDFIQQQLLLERQSNKVLQLSQLETERLMAWLVEDELKQRKKAGGYSGGFSPVCQFLGYQARCSMPSDFDSDYAYSLGGAAAVLATTGRTGYMAVVSDLSRPVREWRVGGAPLTAMLRVNQAPTPDEVRWPRPMLFAARVDLEGAAWRSWCQVREACARDELYENPGPIQFSGPSASIVSTTIATRFSYMLELERLRKHLDDVSSRCRPGCDPRLVRVATRSLATLNAILNELSEPLTAVPPSEGTK